MVQFQKFLANWDINVYPITRRTGSVMQGQIDVMITENERVMKEIQLAERKPREIPPGWLETAHSSVSTKIRISISAPDLRFVKAAQIKYLADKDRGRLSTSLVAAAIDVCNRVRKRHDMVPLNPNRILITTQKTAVVIRFYEMDSRQVEISKKIEDYLKAFSSPQSSGHPLLSDRIPKRAIAIRSDDKVIGVKYKRVRFLDTIKNFDYFLEYETGLITEVRFDLTRFFYLPDLFDKEYCALVACKVDSEEPYYDDLYMQMGRIRRPNVLKAIVIGKNHSEDGSGTGSDILNRLPVFNVDNSMCPVRRVRSEENLKV